MNTSTLIHVVRRELHGSCKNCGNISTGFVSSVLINSENIVIKLCSCCLDRLRTSLKENSEFADLIIMDLI